MVAHWKSGRRVRDDISAWKSPDFRNVFKSRSGHYRSFWAMRITTEFLFVGMATTTLSVHSLSSVLGGTQGSPRDTH